MHSIIFESCEISLRIYFYTIQWPIKLRYASVIFLVQFKIKYFSVLVVHTSFYLIQFSSFSSPCLSTSRKYLIKKIIWEIILITKWPSFYMNYVWDTIMIFLFLILFTNMKWLTPGKKYLDKYKESEVHRLTTYCLRIWKSEQQGISKSSFSLVSSIG